MNQSCMRATAALFSIALFSQANAQSWGLTGNSISSSNFIGSTNNQPLKIKAANKLVLTLNTAGTLSVGSNGFLINPITNNLSVNAGTSTTTYLGLGIGKTASALADGSVAVGSNTQIDAGATNSIAIGSGITGGSALLNNQANTLAVGFNSDVPTLVVTGGNGTSGSIGRVSVGTKTSLSSMTVHNKGTSTNIRITHGGTGEQMDDGFSIIGTGSIFQFKNQEGGAFQFSGGNPDNQITVNPWFIINQASIDVSGHTLLLGKKDGRPQGVKLYNRALVHAATGSDDLVINFDGDFEDGVRIQGPKTVIDGAVAIGTNEVPNGYLLAVKGKVIAEEIKIKLHYNGWPDYVFGDDYCLDALTDVEAFIEHNHHLPNVPSAVEIAQTGADMGEISTILLRKIEELTLYTIEQQKQIDALSSEIATIKSSK